MEISTWILEVDPEGAPRTMHYPLVLQLNCLLKSTGSVLKKKKKKKKKPLMPGLLLWYVCSVGRRWELELGILKNISGDFSV